MNEVELNNRYAECEKKLVAAVKNRDDWDAQFEEYGNLSKRYNVPEDFIIGLDEAFLGGNVDYCDVKGSIVEVKSHYRAGFKTGKRIMAGWSQ